MICHGPTSGCPCLLSEAVFVHEATSSAHGMRIDAKPSRRRWSCALFGVVEHHRRSRRLAFRQNEFLWIHPSVPQEDDVLSPTKTPLLPGSPAEALAGEHRVFGSVHPVLPEVNLMRKVSRPQPLKPEPQSRFRFDERFTLSPRRRILPNWKGGEALRLRKSGTLQRVVAIPMGLAGLALDRQVVSTAFVCICIPKRALDTNVCQSFPLMASKEASGFRPSTDWLRRIDSIIMAWLGLPCALSLPRPHISKRSLNNVVAWIPSSFFVAAGPEVRPVLIVGVAIGGSGMAGLAMHSSVERLAVHARCTHLRCQRR
eukprot:scaffold1964_cov302-Pinguiococcus_pyrenoidosus.AAC.5